MLDNEEKASRIGLGVARGQVREEPLAGHKYLFSFLFSPSRVRQPEGDRDESPAARRRLASARFTPTATRRGRPR